MNHWLTVLILTLRPGTGYLAFWANRLLPVPVNLKGLWGESAFLFRLPSRVPADRPDRCYPYEMLFVPLGPYTLANQEKVWAATTWQVFLVHAWFALPENAYPAQSRSRVLSNSQIHIMS